ncbi:MAG TPA: peptidogalycan biosysnthesis protein [Gemmatimonadaceae bacterium]
MMTAASRPRAFTLRMIGGARYTARADWDALARRGFHRHGWFVAAEACGAVPRHVGVYDGAELVAIIPAYIGSNTLDDDLHARWYGPASRFASAVGAGLRPPLTIGAPMSTGSDPLGADSVLTEDVIDDTMQLLEEEARAEHVKAIVWPFIGEDMSAIRGAARRRGYYESVTSPEAVIDVTWSSPEEYLGSRSKNVRRTLHNELAWVHDQGIRVTWESDLRPHAGAIDALYRASYATRNGGVARLDPRFFAELASQRSPGVRVQCAWHGSTLLEMAIALDGGGVLDLGLRAHADDTGNGLLHQHCLCYDPVRAAIAGGVTQIHLGPAALYSKIVRGARLKTRLTLVRGMTPAARAALRVLSPLTDVRNRRKQRRLVGKLTAPGAAS